MDFKKLHRDARKIQAAHPRMTYNKAKKEAYKLQKGKKISGVKKKQKVTVKPKRSSRIGNVPTTGSAVVKARHEIKEKLGWALATQRTAKTKREKKALQPRINQLTKQLKALC